jgi:hypothetical protein
LVCCDVAKAFQLLGAVWIGHLCGIRYRSMRVMRVSQFIDQTTKKLGIWREVADSAERLN